MAAWDERPNTSISPGNDTIDHGDNINQDDDDDGHDDVAAYDKDGHDGYEVAEEVKPIDNVESRPKGEKKTTRTRQREISLLPTSGSIMIDMGSSSQGRRGSSPDWPRGRRGQGPTEEQRRRYREPYRRTTDPDQGRLYPRDRPRGPPRERWLENVQQRGYHPGPRSRPRGPPDDSLDNRRRPRRPHDFPDNSPLNDRVRRGPSPGRTPNVDRRRRSQSPGRRHIDDIDGRPRRRSASPRIRRILSGNGERVPDDAHDGTSSEVNLSHLKKPTSQEGLQNVVQFEPNARPIPLDQSLTALVDQSNLSELPENRSLDNPQTSPEQDSSMPKRHERSQSLLEKLSKKTTRETDYTDTIPVGVDNFDNPNVASSSEPRKKKSKKKRRETPTASITRKTMDNSEEGNFIAGGVSKTSQQLQQQDSSPSKQKEDQTNKVTEASTEQGSSSREKRRSLFGKKGRAPKSQVDGDTKIPDDANSDGNPDNANDLLSGPLKKQPKKKRKVTKKKGKIENSEDNEQDESNLGRVSPTLLLNDTLDDLNFEKQTHQIERDVETGPEQDPSTSPQNVSKRKKRKNIVAG